MHTYQRVGGESRTTFSFCTLFTVPSYFSSPKSNEIKRHSSSDVALSCSSAKDELDQDQSWRESALTCLQVLQFVADSWPVRPRCTSWRHQQWKYTVTVWKIHKIMLLLQIFSCCTDYVSCFTCFLHLRSLTYSNDNVRGLDSQRNSLFCLLSLYSKCKYCFQFFALYFRVLL